jgi:adenylate cyclase
MLSRASRHGRSRRLRQGRRNVLLGLVGLVTLALALATYGTNLFRGLDLGTVDARFSVRGAQRPPSNVVVVGIDDQTLSSIRPPFPRHLDAEVIARLRRAGAKVIAYDILFAAPSAGPTRYCGASQDVETPDDCALITATRRAGNVVFSATSVDRAGRPNAFGGDVGLLRATAGHTNVPTDPDGTVRRLFYSWQGIPSFAVAAVERATARRVDPAWFGQTAQGTRAAWIDFRGPPGTIREISYSRVLRDHFRPTFFNGKIVVVGTVASAQNDQVHAAVGGGELMSGPELNAEAIDTVLRRVPLRDVSGLLNVALIVLLGLVAPAASVRLTPLKALGVAVISVAGFLLAAQVAFDSGAVISIVYPLLAVVLSSLGAFVVHYVTETRELQRTRLLFTRFVPEDVVDDVLARTDDDLRLGGVQRDGTVMFCDLRDFTRFAESLPAAAVIDVLNRYLTEMSDAILGHGGTLVTYMGDGIMAVFGAPIEQSDHADRAVAAAREMVEWRLARLNVYLRTSNAGRPFRMGVGLNSGPVLSGNVGSRRRVVYTAIGDTTNTAARLEAMTKGMDHQVLIAETTHSRLTEPPADVEYVGEFEVRGRQDKIKLWSFVEPDDSPS